MDDGVSDEQPSERRNANRGYRNLKVWQVAVRYYAVTCRMFRAFPYALRRIASNQMASVDSIHRNSFCRNFAYTHHPQPFYHWCSCHLTDGKPGRVSKKGG